MKRSASAGFTLIEMLMVMVIIAVIAGLIMGVSGLANRKSAATRTLGEIQAISSACESFKTDNGGYPREVGITESSTGNAPIDPRLHGNPNAANYKAASKFLYQQLAGDIEPDGKPGDANGAGDERLKVYLEVRPSMLGYSADKLTVEFLMDPYGNSYGYSTAGARLEDDYRTKAREDTSKDKKPVERSSASRGFNPNFDLWSTAGATVGAPTDADHAKWVKNWN